MFATIFPFQPNFIEQFHFTKSQTVFKQAGGYGSANFTQSGRHLNFTRLLSVLWMLAHSGALMSRGIVYLRFNFTTDCFHSGNTLAADPFPGYQLACPKKAYQSGGVSSPGRMQILSKLTHQRKQSIAESTAFLCFRRCVSYVERVFVHGDSSSSGLA